MLPSGWLQGLVELRHVLNNPGGVDPSLARNLEPAAVDVLLLDKVRTVLTRVPNKHGTFIKNCLSNRECWRAFLENVTCSSPGRSLLPSKAKLCVPSRAPTPGSKTNGRLRAGDARKCLRSQRLASNEMSACSCVPEPGNLAILVELGRHSIHERSCCSVGLRLSLGLCLCVGFCGEGLRLRTCVLVLAVVKKGARVALTRTKGPEHARCLGCCPFRSCHLCLCPWERGRPELQLQLRLRPRLSSFSFSSPSSACRGYHPSVRLRQHPELELLARWASRAAR